jgi:hypothetical protein
MNNQEAIEAIKANYPTSNYTMLREALDMAIESLSKKTEIAPPNLTSKSSGRARPSAEVRFTKYFCVNYHCGFTKKNYCTRSSGTCLRRSLYRVTNNRTKRARG